MTAKPNQTSYEYWAEEHPGEPVPAWLKEPDRILLSGHAHGPTWMDIEHAKVIVNALLGREHFRVAGPSDDIRLKIAADFELEVCDAYFLHALEPCPYCGRCPDCGCGDRGICGHELWCPSGGDALHAEVERIGAMAERNGYQIIALAAHPGEYLTLEPGGDEPSWVEHNSFAEAAEWITERATDLDGDELNPAG